jgi:pectate lyase
LLSLVLPSCSDSDSPSSRDDDADDDDTTQQPSGSEGEPKVPADAGIDGGSDGRARDASILDSGSREGTRSDGGRPNVSSDGGDAGAQQDARASSQLDAAREPEPAPGTCPTTLLGWATQSGDGVTATRGGGDATPVRPKTAAELMMYASDSMPRVIEVAGTFDLPRLIVSSNKTLVGIGKDATIRGSVRIRGKEDAPISNVIVRNLRVDGATTDSDGDAFQLYFAHHIWVDHCEIWDGPDGNLDMTHAVDFVTVSWTKLRYSENYKRPEGESSDHRFASLVGHSDNNADEDMGKLRVTFHHNWWAERVIERMPRVRFGQVHVFNNLFASPGNNYCVRAGRGARLLIEDNYFDGVNSPHEFNSDEDKATAHITSRNNVYQNTTGMQATGGEGMPFTSVPYDAKSDPAERVPTLVRACAGPR